MRAARFSAFALATAFAGCTPAAAPPPAAPAAAPAPPAPPPAPAKPMAMPKFVPPSHNPAAVPSGSYAIEPYHTQVMFTVNHLGITPYTGTFSGVSGTLTVDAKNPARDTLSVSVPVDSVSTTSPKLTEEIKSKMFLDSADYPAMTFKSTKVIPAGKTSAKVIGDLTLHGVTKTVTLDATFLAAGVNPMAGKLNVGFTVSGVIKRSAFGVNAAIPLVSDATKLTIAAAFAGE